MKEDHYILLIQKQLSGEITPTEQGQLNEWLNASPDNQRVEKTIQRTWEVSGGFTQDVELDLEADFKKIAQRLAPAAKREAKIRQLTPRRQLMRLAAAVLLLLVGWFVLDNYLTPAVKYQVVFTEDTPSKAAIELVDGSKVWLNAHSKMTYFTTSVSDERRVKIEGEAFFEVAKDAAKPFVVELPSGEVTVLGTSFSAGEKVDQIAVHVREGKVKLTPKSSGQSITMEANERGIFKKTAGQLVKELTVSLNEIAWHTNKLTFENTTLEKIIEAINQHYKTAFFLENGELKNCPFTVTFDNKTIETVAETLATLIGGEAKKLSDGGYELMGGKCE